MIKSNKPPHKNDLCIPIFLGKVILVIGSLSEFQQYYFLMNIRVLFLSKSILTSTQKNILPPHQYTSTAYLINCCCGLQYISKTVQTLDVRIKLYVPAKIWNFNYLSNDVLNNTYGSSITEHLIKNHKCFNQFSVHALSLLSKAQFLFHLKILDTVLLDLGSPPSVNRGNVCFELM